MSIEQNHPISSDLVKADPDFIDIVEEFVAELPGRLQVMQDAIENSDIDGLRTAAHQLKGSAGGYGYPILTEAATSLEQKAICNEIDECRKNIDEIKDLISRVVVS